MINLLPEENKIFIKKEYRRRLIFIGGLFFAVAAAIGIVLLAPLFFNLSLYGSSFAEKTNLSNDKLSDNGIKEAIEEIKKLNSRVEILLNKKQTTQVNEVLASLIGMKNGQIKIGNLSYERIKSAKSDNVKIFLDGNADKRKDLIEFEDKLNKEFGDKNVNLPVSNLLNDKDIKFSTTITIPYEK